MARCKLITGQKPDQGIAFQNLQKAVGKAIGTGKYQSYGTTGLPKVGIRNFERTTYLLLVQISKG